MKCFVSPGNMTSNLTHQPNQFSLLSMDETVRQYLSSLGKRGGSKTSPAKKKASAENGKRGGWPGHFRKKGEPVQEQKQPEAQNVVTQ
jgi:hypothetical protein